MPKKTNKHNEVEENCHTTGGDTGLCDCKKIKGLKLYANFQSWLPRPSGIDFDELTPEQQLAWIMAANGKYNNK